ncbi:o-succinylbenzoate synthase [Ornithinicoccus hortensis]|uniref:o-succinylbenzoate synthase n=1 Tax=Ornithinicoccus hortensis TaxID=82346 RepID=A0A542YVS7_9MICO|nr:o-succinylbenzoate synthase [Ornithinicoccus hortensis]TQL52177.1 O-succinylbenzoate synthase [Ornithinicoccus hortensis]
MPSAATPAPSPEELVAAATVVSLPMRVRFRGVLEREAVLLHGPLAWAEFAPFPEYADEEAARWLAAAVEAGWAGWPEPVRDRVPVNATVPAVGPDRVGEVLARYDGCTTAKVKVAERGQELADDMARVAEVRAVLGPAARIRVDANGGWTPDQAREALTRLSAYGLEYAEQPCADVPGLARLRRDLARDGVDVPVAADESIRRSEDPLRVAREGAADLVVVKVPPLGGVAAALRIVADCGLPAVVSSALDTSVGMAAGVALAAALPALEHACGLGTVELLARDVATPSLVPVAGSISVADALQTVRGDLVPGLTAGGGGDLAAGPERRAWWLDRLARCAALLPRA